MIVVFLGAPGSGKGTQAARLATAGYDVLSTGEVFRQEIRSGSQLGMQVKAIVEGGNLVSDEILFDILKPRLATFSGKKLILDGFPRTREQAQWLGRHFDVSRVVHLDISESALEDRLGGRSSCASCGELFHDVSKPPRQKDACDRCGGPLVRRPDDSPESVRVRLQAFQRDTAPVIDYYRGHSQYVHIDAAQDPESVAEEIFRALN
jgi:adenylate kinase